MEANPEALGRHHAELTTTGPPLRAHPWLMDLPVSKAGASSDHCPKCNHLLQDSAAPECPDCGFAAAQTVPDWEAIPFDAACGRCGESLRGVQQAECPHCQLRFDWSEVLPIEDLRCSECGYQLMGAVSDRCPECGRHFQWVDVLAAARSRRSQLFEHFAFRRPLRSLLRTWCLATFRPTKLWSEYNLHDPPKALPLILFAILQGLVFWVSWDAAAYVIEPSMNTLNRWWYAPLPVARTFGYQFRPNAERFYLFAAVWFVATFASLQLFFISKRMYRVQWRQILRVYVHATALIAFYPALLCLVEMAIDMSWFFAEDPNWDQVLLPLYPRLQNGVGWPCLLVVWAWTWLGYHKYLRMPRGWGIAALSLLLGELLAELAMIYA